MTKQEAERRMRSAAAEVNMARRSANPARMAAASATYTKAMMAVRAIVAKENQQ